MNFYTSKIKGGQTSGFTLAEVLIATVILSMIIGFASQVYFSFFGSVRNLRAANNIYEEARITIERISQEVRGGTIDYEEYFNRRGGSTYGQNYCAYSRIFYSPGNDGEYGTFDDESLGKKFDPLTPSAIDGAFQPELYLINSQGDRRVFIKRLERDGIGRVGLLKMDGHDYGYDNLPANPPTLEADLGEGDGLIDTWTCSDGFTCGADNMTVTDSSFADITPPSLDVLDVQFIIQPLDDPRKAYNTPEVQVHPNVTIKLTAQANEKLAFEFKGAPPSISLNSTVSARAQEEVITECNRSECLNGTTQACPLTQGVCLTATQTCSQSIWPGCSTETYEAASGGLYQPGSEFADCTNDTCRQSFCSDGFDNDCDGLTDDEDPDCIYLLCTNGIQDADEVAPDVGIICGNLEAIEVSCFDGLDNDDDGRADYFDDDCRKALCTNGVQDPVSPNNFVASPYSGPLNDLREGPFATSTPATQAYYEVSVDIGGICGNITVADTPLGQPNYGDNINHSVASGSETAHCTNPADTACLNRYCSDNLDNDNDGNADEFDSDCQTPICTNNTFDEQLAPASYSPKDYLGDYSDPFGTLTSENDELCKNIGGICASLPGHQQQSENSFALCTDNLDNDCNEKTDIQDPSCCIDADGDGYGMAGISGACSGVPGKNVAADPNDNDPTINPGIDEADYCFDGKDNDGDGFTDGLDSDCGGAGATQAIVTDDNLNAFAGIGPQALDVLANDNPQVDPNSLVITGGGSNGAATVQNGEIIYTPDDGFTGTDTITYQITYQGDIFTGTVTVTVVSLNVIANNDTFYSTGNSSELTNAIASLHIFYKDINVVSEIINNDTDFTGSGLNSDSFIIKPGSGPNKGNIVNQGGGIYRYTPFTDSLGQDSFTYTIKSNSGDSSNEATVTINIGFPNLVFVTSKYVSGNLGSDPEAGGQTGYLAGDAICQAEAYKTGSVIPPGKTFKAWLSVSTSNVKDRFTHSPFHYILPNGSIIANNWDDLTDGALSSAISITYTGNISSGSTQWWDNQVFTGSYNDGTFVSSNESCCNFTEIYGQGGSFKACQFHGYTHFTSTTNWNVLPLEGGYSCQNNQRKLYCFEQ